MECWCQCARRRWTPSWFSWAGAMAYEAPPLPNTVRCRVCLQRMSPKAWKEAWKNNVSVSVNTLYMCIFSQEWVTYVWGSSRLKGNSCRPEWRMVKPSSQLSSSKRKENKIRYTNIPYLQYSSRPLNTRQRQRHDQHCLSAL